MMVPNGSLSSFLAAGTARDGPTGTLPTRTRHMGVSPEPYPPARRSVVRVPGRWRTWRPRRFGASRCRVIGSTTGGHSVDEKTMTSRSRGMARWRRVGWAAGATGMVPLGWRPTLSSQMRSVS
jgi:hypothetical protein